MDKISFNSVLPNKTILNINCTIYRHCKMVKFKHDMAKNLSITLIASSQVTKLARANLLLLALAPQSLHGAWYTLETELGFFFFSIRHRSWFNPKADKMHVSEQGPITIYPAANKSYCCVKNMITFMYFVTQ